MNVVLPVPEGPEMTFQKDVPTTIRLKLIPFFAFARLMTVAYRKRHIFTKKLPFSCFLLKQELIHNRSKDPTQDQDQTRC